MYILLYILLYFLIIFYTHKKSVSNINIHIILPVSFFDTPIYLQIESRKSPLDSRLAYA